MTQNELENLATCLIIMARNGDAKTDIAMKAVEVLGGHKLRTKAGTTLGLMSMDTKATGTLKFTAKSAFGGTRIIEMPLKTFYDSIFKHRTLAVKFDETKYRRRKLCLT